MQDKMPGNSVLAHVRANVSLLILSVLICCVLYPGAVWLVAQLPFLHNQAQGSLIDAEGKPTNDDAKAVGSTLIAQAFTSSVYFQSRPSATSPNPYNAAASGGSNYGASNPMLRGRVAQQLGPIVRYTEAYQKAHPKSDGGAPNPQDDIVAWFKAGTAAKRDLFTEWATNNSTLAQSWAKGSAPISDYINQWVKDHSADVIDAWKKANPDNKKNPPGPDDVVVFFFTSYEKEHFGTWPTVEGAMVKPDAQDSDVQSTFFDTWLTEQATLRKADPTKGLDPLKDFEQVPADMVTASGSGLDPDVTLRNAKYQSETVVAANRDAKIADYKKAHNDADPTKEQKDKVEAEIRKDVDDLLSQWAYRPMFGLTGDEQLVNVLQLNLALKAKIGGVEIK